MKIYAARSKGEDEARLSQIISSNGLSAKKTYSRKRRIVTGAGK